MGLLDFFGGGSGPEKAQKLKAKVIQKYGDPLARQKALDQLGGMKIPEAVSALMARFTINVEPGTTDSDEKDHTFALIQAMGQDAVAPVKEFLKRNDAASSWALRLLSALLPESEVVAFVSEYLTQLGAQYTRDPEKKTVLIHYLSDKQDERVAPALLAQLEDPADDVKIAALSALGPRAYEPAREPILKVLTAEETGRRVQTSAIAALQQSNFGVQGYREKVEALLSDPYFVDKSGVVKKRG